MNNFNKFTPSVISPYFNIKFILEYKWSILRVLIELDLRINPHTSYSFSSKSSAKYDPSCPVIPVMNATFIYMKRIVLFLDTNLNETWFSISSNSSFYFCMINIINNVSPIYVGLIVSDPIEEINYTSTPPCIYNIWYKMYSPI